MMAYNSFVLTTDRLSVAKSHLYSANESKADDDLCTILQFDV